VHVNPSFNDLKSNNWNTLGGVSIGSKGH
jgi:hypothetical protein